jgi:hypothetical protein
MNELSDLAHIIELAVAPVFLLAGIGAFLNVMASRLARIVDRSRSLEARCGENPDEMEIERIRSELSVLDKRTAYAQRGIFLFSVAALMVCDHRDAAHRQQPGGSGGAVVHRRHARHDRRAHAFPHGNFNRHANAAGQAGIVRETIVLFQACHA